MSAIHYGTSACLRGFSQCQKSLPSADVSLSSQISVTALEDEFGRFRVWAANIGALQKGHSSLDYRLREASLVQQNVLKLLKELHRCLQEINVVLTGTRLPYDQQPPLADDASDTSSSSDDLSSDQGLSRMIRAPALHSRTSKAAVYKQIDPDTGVDLLTQYKTLDFAYVTEAFFSLRRESGVQSPSLSEEDLEMVRRFSAGITKRRQQFLYWKKHRHKLAVHARKKDFEVNAIVRPEMHPARPVLPNEPQDFAPVPIPEVEAEDWRITIRNAIGMSVGRSELTATTATIFNPSDQVSESGHTATSFASTARSLHEGRIDLPSLPVWVRPGKDFECQYCFAIVPARYQSEKAWRKHILRDLRPYLCTYFDCPNGGLLFTSRHEWSEHEQSSHRRQWTCPEHPDQKFKLLQDFNRHIEQELHQVPAILSSTAMSDISRGFQEDERKSCLVCLAVFDRTELLQNHIADDLERFAAFSLPRDIDTCDDDEMSHISSNRPRGSHAASVAESDLSATERRKRVVFRELLEQIEPFLTGIHASALLQVHSVLTRLISLDDEEFNHFEENFNDHIPRMSVWQNLMEEILAKGFLIDTFLGTDYMMQEFDTAAAMLSGLPRFGKHTPFVRALFNFPGVELNELGFIKGDIIHISEERHDDVNWWEGSLFGKTGLFPVNYVELLPARPA